MVLERFIECWEGLDDPRTGNAALHDLHEILTIAICAVLCGGQGSVDMGLFAKSKEPFLRGFLKLDNGVPSHDTFSRRFSGSWPASPGNAQELWRSTARFCAVRSTMQAASRRCTWSPPGAASNASCWRRSPPTRSQTKSPLYRSYWRC